MTGKQCTKYAHATVTIHFPDEIVCCDRCPLMETYARKQCRMTGEYLADTRFRPWTCPLKVEGEDETVCENLDN